MKILFLGYDEQQTRLISLLREMGHEVTHHQEKIDAEMVTPYDLVISFGYRFIIKKAVIEACKRPPINLHISLLPFNRGTHPNFWAWYDNTPHGVSIHHIDAGLDTGDLIVQEEVFFEKEITLSESYAQLIKKIEDLFDRHKEEILQNRYTPTPQAQGGSKHSLKDLPTFDGGWEQTISDIKERINASN